MRILTTIRVLCAACLCSFIIAGCMETTMVPEQLPRTMEVSARITNATTGAQVPLNGVAIRLYEHTGLDSIDRQPIAGEIRA